MSPALDSHVRYLSGLLLAIGLTFWSSIPRIEDRTTLVRLLTAMVVLGGLARAIGFSVSGWPGTGMAFGLAMELVVTPLLCLWQGRVARLADLAAARGRRRCGREAALLQQRLDVRIAAAELAIGLGAIGRVAGREDERLEPRRRLVPGTAGLGERLPGVGVHHLGPQVAVVAGRVRVAA